MCPLLLSSLCTTILSPWPRRHGQCRCSLRQQRHGALEGVGLFLCERLDCHCRSAISLTQCNHLPFVSAAGSRRSRQPRPPIKQRRLHARRHLCDGCVQSSLLMRSILGNRGHVTTSDSSVHTCSAWQHAPAGEARAVRASRTWPRD